MSNGTGNTSMNSWLPDYSYPLALMKWSFGNSSIFRLANMELLSGTEKHQKDPYLFLREREHIGIFKKFCGYTLWKCSWCHFSFFPDGDHHLEGEGGKKKGWGRHRERERCERKMKQLSSKGMILG